MSAHRCSIVLSITVCVPFLVPTPRVAAQVQPDCVTGCGAYGVSVTPDGAVQPSRSTQTGGYVATFTVRNTGSNSDTYDLYCSATNAGCTSLSKSSVTLAGGAQTTVDATYSVGTPGSGRVTVRAFPTAGEVPDTGYVTIPIVVPSGGPVIDATPYNSDNQDYGRCAQACFAATYAQGTVPYFSLGAPRNVTLAYNGDRVAPKPFVLINVSPDLGHAGTPSEYRLQVKVNGALVTFLNTEQTLRFAYPGTTAPARLGGQFDAGSYTTGVYPMEIIVSALYGTSLIANSLSTRLFVVNEATNPVARGWTIGGVQRLYVQGDGSALITAGDGSAAYFRKNGSTFTSPAGDLSSLIAGTPYGSGWTRRFADSTKVIFDATGKMIEVRDRFVNKTTITYDASSRIWKITDPQTLVITLAYATNGLSTITDAGSPARVTNVTVDASKRLTGIRDPDNISTTFGYDASNRLSTITNRNGKTTTLGYDGNAGTLAAVTAPSVIFYDGSSGSPVVTYAAWQKAGVPYVATAGTPFTPPRADTVYARVTEPGGAVTGFTVNRWGTPVQVTDAMGHVLTTTFDANGLPIKTVYPSGAVDSAVFNTSGLPTFVQSADATNRRTIRYAGWAQPDSARGGPRPAMRAFIGTNGRVDSVRVAGTASEHNRVTHYVYDAIGRVVSDTDGEHHLLRRRWFAGVNGNLSKDSLPGGGVTTFGYDTYGRNTTVDGPVSPLRQTDYDLLNRPTQFHDGVYTPPTVTSYDSAGHVVSVTDEKGQVYRFTYNALGWLTARTDPTGKADTLKYNRDGDLMRLVNRRNQTISFAYDALHRITSKSGTNSDSNGWGYATNGRVLAATDPVSTDSTFLNVRGQPDSVVTRVAGHRYARVYAYTGLGLLDSVVVTNDAGLSFRRRVYDYNASLLTLDSIRLNKPAAAPAGITAVARNNDFLPVTTTYRGGEQVTQQYSTRNSLAQISSGALYGPTIGKSVQYDAAGRLLVQVNGDQVTARQFTYDGLGRLRSDTALVAQSPPPECGQGQIIGDNGVNCIQYYTWQAQGGTAFSYDSVGNRRDQGGLYGTGNRITSFAGCGYTTDADGNVTGRTACGSLTATFKWTAESRLDTVIVGGQTIGYRYDAAGRLVRKDVSGSPQSHFLWDGQNLLAELNGAGTGLVVEYSYYGGLDNPHAIVTNGVEYDYHQDVVGNVVAVTDSAQNVVREYGYDAWGNLTGGMDNLPFSGADRVRWKGALWIGNEANLYYMRARWYEPATGRFLSEDPLGLIAGVNIYAFANNDPTDGRDPTGACPTGSELQTAIVTLHDGSQYAESRCVPASNNSRGEDYFSAYGMPNAISEGWDLNNISGAPGGANYWADKYWFETTPLAELRQCKAIEETIHGVTFKNVTVIIDGIPYLGSGTGGMSVWRGRKLGYHAKDPSYGYPRSGTYYAYGNYINIAFDAPIAGYTSIHGRGIGGRVHCESGTMTGGGIGKLEEPGTP